MHPNAMREDKDIRLSSEKQVTLISFNIFNFTYFLVACSFIFVANYFIVNITNWDFNNY